MSLEIISKQTSPGTVTLLMTGQIDTETYEILTAEIYGVLSGPINSLVLDMKDVDFITSSGIGAIVKAKASLAAKGADLAIVNLQPQIKKVFAIIRLLPVLNVFESVAELDEYLSNIQRNIVDQDDEF